MKNLIFCLTLFCVATSGFAALRPEHQRRIELDRIINSAEVAQALNEHPIEAISYSGNNLYHVDADGCSIDVQTVTIPYERGMVGPRKFYLQILNSTGC